MRNYIKTHFNIKNLTVIVMAVVMVLCMTPVTADAATVKLNKTKATIYVGSTTTLKVKGTSQKAKWTSNKKSVATVNNKGKVTAKKAGKATITAKIGSRKFSCKVTVKNPYLNKKSITLTKGKTYTLKLTGSKAKSWTSSKKSVATVNNKGKITAKKSGKTTISVKAANKKTYKCVVTVKAKNTDSDTDDDLAHSHDGYNNFRQTLVKEATCTEEGAYKYTCIYCGYEKTETISPRGHEYVNPTCIKKATCIEGFVYQETCSQCGDVKTYQYEDTDPYNHDYEMVHVEPTCTEWGKYVYTCKDCGHVDTISSGEQPKHDYNTVVTDPTRNSRGYTTYTCKNCDDTYKGDYTYLAFQVTEEQAYADIMALQEQYPEGTVWDDDSVYVSCVGKSYSACDAFAHMLSDTVFGAMSWETTTLDNLKIGDYVGYFNSQGGLHAVIVIGVEDDGVTVAEGNVIIASADNTITQDSGIVHWGRKITFEFLKENTYRIYTRYSAEGVEGIQKIN